MKHAFLISTAMVAFALSVSAPQIAAAQDSEAEPPSRPSHRMVRPPRADRDTSEAPTIRESRPAPSPPSDTGGGRGGNDGGGFRDRVRPSRPDVASPPSTTQGGGANRDRDGAQERPRRPGGGDWNGARPDRPERPRGDGDWRRDLERDGSQDRPDRPRGDSGWNRDRDGGQDRPDRSRGDSGWNRDRDRGDNAQGRDRDRDGRGGWNRDRDGNGRGGWDRNRPGAGQGGWNRDRDRTRREWRQRFDRDQWRRDFYRDRSRDWWRNDYRFRGYSGLRIGFYFAPGYGYYSVPRSYWGRDYQVGDYLPSIFWRYSLNDWRTYGLGIPPAGTRWVLVDNNIYLIDEYDGYIIDVVYDAWAW